MTIKLFSKKTKKANRKKNQRPELKVVQGIDFTSRKKVLSKIFRYRREMFPENIEVFEDKKNLSAGN